MTRSTELIEKLTSKLFHEHGVSGTDYETISQFLGLQSLGTLEEMNVVTGSYSDVEWKALSYTLFNFYLEERIWGEPEMPYPEFYLRLSLQMVPMLVLEYGKDHSSPEAIAYDTYACIDGMACSVEVTWDSVRYACASYLTGTYGLGGDFSNDDLQWLSDNAAQVVLHPDTFFVTSGFDRLLAAERLSVEAAPMRAGVL